MLLSAARRVGSRALAQAPEHRVEAVGEGRCDLAGLARRAVQLARAHGLAERLAEVAADAHHLADRLHLRGERLVGARELLEGEPRRLHDHVVDRRLEAGRGRARDVVRDLVERVADREPRGDLRDRIARCLARERRRPRHARVHLDHDDLAGLAVDPELHVRAAGLDAHGADHGGGRVAQGLELAVRQRHRGRDADRVAGVHAHRDRCSRSSTRSRRCRCGRG